MFAVFVTVISSFLSLSLPLISWWMERHCCLWILRWWWSWWTSRQDLLSGYTATSPLSRNTSPYLDSVCVYNLSSHRLYVHLCCTKKHEMSISHWFTFSVPRVAPLVFTEVLSSQWVVSSYFWVASLKLLIISRNESHDSDCSEWPHPQ